MNTMKWIGRVLEYKACGLLGYLKLSKTLPSKWLIPAYVEKVNFVNSVSWSLFWDSSSLLFTCKFKWPSYLLVDFVCMLFPTWIRCLVAKLFSTAFYSLFCEFSHLSCICSFFCRWCLWYLHLRTTGRGWQKQQCFWLLLDDFFSIDCIINYLLVVRFLVCIVLGFSFNDSAFENPKLIDFDLVIFADLTQVFQFAYGLLLTSWQCIVQVWHVHWSS